MMDNSLRSPTLSPEMAVEHLIALHAEATDSLRTCLDRYFDTRVPPSDEERQTFRYPELVVRYEPADLLPRIARSFAKFEAPGTYTTTVAHPAHFRRYLVEQLTHLVDDYGATIEVRRSTQQIPYPYVLETGDDLGRNGVTAAELVLHFPGPNLAVVGDEIADGDLLPGPGQDMPLALFDAVRVDYSLKRLQHYTGTDWRHVQPWILLTNYHRYVDQFVKWGVGQLMTGSPYDTLHLPGGGKVTRGMSAAEAEAVIEASPWHRFQMPAYHLARRDGDGGVTLVNIGVGPSNAKNITDHLAVLRPHCWLMVGHCGGLRQSQRIGDYVLAHAYLREDKVLDDDLPVWVPIPALAEVQVALEDAVEEVTGLDYDRFTRSVLLSQGDFAAFLRAGERERRGNGVRRVGRVLQLPPGLGADRHAVEGARQGGDPARRPRRARPPPARSGRSADRRCDRRCRSRGRRPNPGWSPGTRGRPGHRSDHPARRRRA